ncbi:MAG: plastocyanin/azurin family copper-binding protein [Oligoflexia bacterium]|nr:plastocyanin/azurin family copper-binding protein [Oligoflexia bacterium]
MQKITLILITFLAITSCTKKSDNNAANSINNTPTLSVIGESMQFDKTELTVKAGEKVTLIFKNPSTTLEHNWLLTQKGKENDIGLAGIKVGKAKQFVPDDPAVLAHTRLVEPGGQDTITFTAPPAGDYPYICTNAGHHMVMKGILHSK